MNITYKEKDTVLQALCNNNIPIESIVNIDTKEFLNECKLNGEILNSILTYFSRIGFVSELNYRYGAKTFFIMIHIEMFDFYNRGGFEAQENILKNNIIKLNAELELLAKELEPKFLEKAGTISTIGSAILSSIALFYK